MTQSAAKPAPVPKPAASPGSLSSLTFDHPHKAVWISVGGAEPGRADLRAVKDLISSLTAWVRSMERDRP